MGGGGDVEGRSLGEMIVNDRGEVKGRPPVRELDPEAEVGHWNVGGDS